MSPIDDQDRVIQLSDQPSIDTGAPEPFVVCDEHSLGMSYWLNDNEASDRGYLCRFIRFKLPLFHQMGPPNDEALPGHPLYGSGLGYYGFYRVEQSSLVRKLCQMNSVHPRHNPAAFEGFTHWIITFHDSTFECVAKSFEGETVRVTSAEKEAYTLQFFQQG